VEILGKGTAQEIVILYLIGLLKDESMEVRQASIAALGNLKAQLAYEPILQIVRQEKHNLSLRQSALMSIAKISATQAMPILLELLQTPDSEIRSAVAQALADIPDDSRAIQSLIALMSGDASKMVRQIACNSLSKIKSKEALKAIVKIAQKGSNVEARIMAIQALRHRGNARVLPIFTKILEDKEEEIRLEAAFSLAYFYDKRAVPVLIVLLEKQEQTHLIRKFLEKLTLATFPEQDKLALKERYQDWWTIHKDLPERQWLFDALRVRGYNMTPMLDYLLEGKKSSQAIPLLLHALHDKDWFIRAAACHTLEQFTGQSFGKIHYYTGDQTTNEIKVAWKKWYESQQK
jgi:HEAT repeat protein